MKAEKERLEQAKYIAETEKNLYVKVGSGSTEIKKILKQRNVYFFDHKSQYSPLSRKRPPLVPEKVVA